jgi:hypothetical protein
MTSFHGVAQPGWGWEFDAGPAGVWGNQLADPNGNTLPANNGGLGWNGGLYAKWTGNRF